MAGDLEYALLDLHWDNIGLTVDHAVVLVDCEGMYHAPTAKPTVKYGSGVGVWIKNLGHDAAKHRAGAWGPILGHWSDVVRHWWGSYTACLPSLAQVAALGASLAETAAAHLPPIVAAAAVPAPQQGPDGRVGESSRARDGRVGESLRARGAKDPLVGRRPVGGSGSDGGRCGDGDSRDLAATCRGWPFVCCRDASAADCCGTSWPCCLAATSSCGIATTPGNVA